MGFDKAFLGYGQHWLLLQNAHLLRKVFASVVLVAEDAQKFAQYPAIQAFPILQDQHPGCGPLGGICTALRGCSTPYVLLTACDMPYLRTDLLLRLYETILPGDQVVLYTYQDKPQPLFAFYHQSCLPVLEQQIREGRLKIRQDFYKFQVREIALTHHQDACAFINLNTPQDLSQWQENTLEEMTEQKGGDV